MVPWKEVEFIVDADAAHVGFADQVTEDDRTTAGHHVRGAEEENLGSTF
jgi:hypothetical protein